MNTKLTVVASLALLVLSSTTVGAYTGWREAVLPGGADETVTGRGAGLAFCERVSDDIPVSPNPSPIFCEGSGFSVQFTDIGCSTDFVPAATIPPFFFGDGVADNDATAGNGFASGAASASECLDDIDGTALATTGDNNDATFEDYAEGTVTFTAGGTGGPGDFNWLVGNDRDNDGSTTTSDTDGSNDLSAENGSGPCNDDARRVTAGCFDDEFLTGTVVSGALPTTTPRFCFTRDRNWVGGQWDSFPVFLGANIPGGVPYVGTLKVEMTVNSFNTNFPNCTARSGHPTDAAAQLGGAPIAGPTGTGIDCEILLLPQAVPGSAATGSCGAINCSLLGLTAFVAVVALVDVSVDAIGGCLNDSAAAGTGVLSTFQVGDDEPNGVGIVSATSNPTFPVGIDSARVVAALSPTFACQASTPAGTGLGGLGICIISPI